MMTRIPLLLAFVGLISPISLPAQAQFYSSKDTFTICLQAREKIRLDWSKTDEQDNKLYQVERSRDGKNFQAAGQIYAYNQAGLQKYVFVDRNPFPGLNYYRYARINMHDQINYSSVQCISIQNSEAQAMLIPDVDEERGMDLSLSLNQSEKVKVELLDAHNKQPLLLLHDGPVEMGNHQIDLPAEELQSGNFTVRVEGISFRQDMQLILL